jgi:pimeloyl-ACP methyl ester carboxylesterase
MNRFFNILIISFCLTSCSKETKFIETEVNIPSEKITVNGALIAPENGEKAPLIIIIPGSGPNDRNGNVGMVKNNSLKLLAEGLKDHNIATYRYDKSALEWMKIKGFKEEDGSFDDFIIDAKSVVKYFKNTDTYSKIIIAGHSQGSLVGMLTATESVDAFISIAGAGRTIDTIIIEQIGKQAPSLIEEARMGFETLKIGGEIENINPSLMSFLRPSAQPFMMSWMKYNPQEELKKLTIPTLIINGTKDIQVPVSDAKLLNVSNSTSEIKIIENMNHIFREITDDSQNIPSYTNPDLPIMNELITSIATFVKK